jgi:branched-chain amino acid transport system permease protein
VSTFGGSIAIRAGSLKARLITAGAAVLPLALMVLGVKLFWRDVPSGVYADGVVRGLLSALIALGIVIVYRANRIVNFAAADLGAVPSTLAFLLYATLGWNVYLALVCGFGAAVVLGVLVEFLFLRRFFRAPRMIVTVATIGITQILVSLGLLLPVWIGRPDVDALPTFIDAHFEIGGTAFDGNDLLVVLAVPVVLLGLLMFFRFTAIGIALRASAESADRASLLGIPVKRLQSVVWALVTVLAFIAIYLRTGVEGAALGRVLEPSVLLAALGAAVIGRMERMPTVVLASIGLGIVASGARFHYPSDAYRSAIIAAIIAVALLLQRSTSVSRLAGAATSTWQATREVKPVPAELRREPAVRAAQWGLAALGALCLVLIPVMLSENRVRLSATIAIYAVIGLSLVVLTGWAGQVSLGQMAFVGVAGAFAGMLATRYHWDTSLILVAAGGMGAVTTIVVGVPTLRVRGLAFAVMTLAFALVCSDYLLNEGYSPVKEWLPSGRVPRTDLFGVIDMTSDTRFYWLSVAVLVLALIAVRGLRKTRTGRVLIGVRDNERAAEAYAIGARGSLVLAFGVSGFIAGVGGALFVLQQQALDHASFLPAEGLKIFSMVVVGGLGSMAGCVLGAVFVYGTNWFLTGRLADWSFLSTGIGLLLVLMLLPGGLGAALGDARDAALRWYARRRGIRVPSLVADTRVVPPPVASKDLVAAVAEAVERPEIEQLAEMHD